MAIGIVSYGLYLPAEFETAQQVATRSGLRPEQVRALGIERKCLPNAAEQPVPMATKAARQALQRAGDVTPDQVDVVIWTGEEYKDYIAQTPSIRLQEEIGCRNAWAFDLVGQGVTLIQGLRAAQDLALGDRNVRTVLLAGGTRNLDLVDYANPDTRFLLATAASGSALVVRREHPENRLLGTAFSVDPEMADAVYVPGGGTETPFAPDNLDSRSMFYQSREPAALADYLANRWPEALVRIARDVLGAAAPDYLALRHLAPAERSRVLQTLGLEPTQSAALDRWGHHGTNDPILSLDLGLKAGLITNGSRVAWVAAGIGFTYGAALIRWGR